jgi:hypothetical protein
MEMRGDYRAVGQFISLGPMGDLQGVIDAGRMGWFGPEAPTTIDRQPYPFDARSNVSAAPHPVWFRI